MSSKQISFKAFVELEQAAAYLDDLSKSLREGTVFLRQGQEVVELTPGEGVEIEVEAAEKKGKQKLSLEFSWRRMAEPETDTAAGLVITSEKPEIASPDEDDQTEDEDAASL